MKGCTCTSCHMDNTESHRAIDFVLSKRTYIRTALRDERIIPKSASTISNTQTSTHKRNNIFLLNKPARCKLFCDSHTRIDISLLWLNNLCRSLYCFLMLLLRHRLFNSLKVFFVLALLFCPQLFLSVVGVSCSSSPSSHTTSSCQWHAQLQDAFDVSFCNNKSEFDRLKFPSHSSYATEFKLDATNSSCVSEHQLRHFNECDAEARTEFEQFRSIMDKYVSPNEYIINSKQSANNGLTVERSCNILQCLHHYKRWVCSNFCIDFISGVERREACENTERLCPIFRIFYRTKIRGGQPVFLCQGFQGDKWNYEECDTGGGGADEQCKSGGGGGNGGSSNTTTDGDRENNSTVSRSTGGVASAASSINVLSWSVSNSVHLNYCVITLLSLTAFFLSW